MSDKDRYRERYFNESEVPEPFPGPPNTPQYSETTPPGGMSAVNGDDMADVSASITGKPAIDLLVTIAAKVESLKISHTNLADSLLEHIEAERKRREMDVHFSRALPWTAITIGGVALICASWALSLSTSNARAVDALYTMTISSAKAAQ